MCCCCWSFEWRHCLIASLTCQLPAVRHYRFWLLRNPGRDKQEPGNFRRRYTSMNVRSVISRNRRVCGQLLFLWHARHSVFFISSFTRGCATYYATFARYRRICSRICLGPSGELRAPSSHASHASCHGRSSARILAEALVRSFDSP